MTMIKLIYKVTLLLIVFTLLLDCTNDSVSGNTSEVGNAIGILYNPNGSRAANAKVYIISVDHNPKPIHRIRAIDSTITDDTGAFVVDSVPEGYYNILGSGDSGISYADSLFIDNDTIPTEVSDTLREPGTLRGVVRLQGDDDSRTVFILIFGTQTWTAPIDSIGNFTLTNMAEGTYHVRILTTLDDYGVLDTNLTITAGTVDTLNDTIFLPFTGIPIPKGLTLNYDTMKQIVTLTWNKADTTLVKGYNVYRKHSDSDFVKINTAIITDTTYSDSSAIQDETYEYKIKAVNMSDEEGEFSEGVKVVVVSAYNFINTIGDSGIGTGQLHTPSDIAIDNKGNFWVTDNYRDKVLKFSSGGDFLLEWGIEGTDTGQLEHPFGIDIDADQNIYIAESQTSRIQVFDTAGNFIREIDSLSSQSLWDVTVDNNGFIYTFKDGGGSNFIQKHDSLGNFVLEWAVQSIWFKRSILARNDTIYLAGAKPKSGQPYDDNILELFDTEGGAIGIINIRQNNETGVIDIRDLDIDANGYIYATDPENGLIRVFDINNSSFLTSFGKKGNGDGEFSWIQGIAVSQNGTIAITDRYRIHIFQLP